MIWATTLSRHLRPFLAPLFADLHSPPGALFSVDHKLWDKFQAALDAKAVLTQEVAGLWIPKGAQIVQHAGRTIHCKADIFPLPPQSKLQWVRVRDTHAKEIRLRKPSTEALHWLQQVLHLDRMTSLRAAPHIACLAAADACADENSVGIGGWAVTSGDVGGIAFSDQGCSEIHHLL